MGTVEQQGQEQDRRRRLLLLLLLAVLLLLVLLLLEWWTGSTAGGGARSAVPRAGTPTGAPVVVGGSAGDVRAPTEALVDGASGAGLTRSGALAVVGVVRGEVAPGSPAALVVSIANREGRPLVVTEVSARVTDVGSGCSAAWYRVVPFSGSRAVPAHGSASVELPVTFLDLPDLNQDACKGARYAFRYTVRAVPA